MDELSLGCVAAHHRYRPGGQMPYAQSLQLQIPDAGTQGMRGNRIYSVYGNRERQGNQTGVDQPESQSKSGWMRSYMRPHYCLRNFFRDTTTRNGFNGSSSEKCNFFFRERAVIKKLLHILLDLITHQLQMLQSRSTTEQSSQVRNAWTPPRRRNKTHHTHKGREEKNEAIELSRQQGSSAHTDELPAPTKESSASL